MKFLIVFTTLLALSFGKLVPYKDCGSQKGKILGVSIEPCDNAKTCTLKKGTSPRISANFTTNEVITSLQAKVAGIIPGGIKVPFPLDEPNACRPETGVSCPIEASTEVHYSESIRVLESYPDWKVIVQWQLVDQNDQVVICFVVATKIAP